MVVAGRGEGDKGAGGLVAPPRRPAPARRARQNPLQVSPLLIAQVTAAHAGIIPASPHHNRLMKHGLAGAHPAAAGGGLFPMIATDFPQFLPENR